MYCRVINRCYFVCLILTFCLVVVVVVVVVVGDAL